LTRIRSVHVRSPSRNLKRRAALRAPLRQGALTAHDSGVRPRIFPDLESYHTARGSGHRLRPRAEGAEAAEGAGCVGRVSIARPRRRPASGAATASRVPPCTPKGASVHALDVRDRIEAMRDARDALGLEHAQHLVEPLVHVPALVERRALAVADDAAHDAAAERALDVAHLGVDLALTRRELALRLAAREHAPRAVIHGAARSVRTLERKQNRRAVEHRARHEARVARVGPSGAGEIRVPGWERAR